MPASYYLILGALLFGIGIAGVLTRRSALVVFMSIELMLNAVNLTFVALSRHAGTFQGHLWALFIMTVAAAEIAVGLALIVLICRNRGTTNIDEINLLKG
ncbi:MAG: NADH-quinone oxidoreductase subunit NuoK [Pseudomonadota bacterium]